MIKICVPGRSAAKQSDFIQFIIDGSLNDSPMLLCHVGNNVLVDLNAAAGDRQFLLLITVRFASLIVYQ